MIKFNDMRLVCHWDKTRNCENCLMCSSCEYQPADDDKPNGKREPVKIGWETSFGGTYPQCPACGEMPYSTKRCTFCGQKFIQDDPELQEYTKPPEKVRMYCPACGGENTMVGHKARCNGHFHGHCERCGCSMVQ